MANADITKPVVINATTTTLIESGEFLRSVAFVSFGESLLNEGETSQEDRATYSDNVADLQNELSYRLQNFFAYASNKLATIIELGEQTRSKASDTYANYKGYAETLSGYSVSGYNGSLYALWSAVSGNETNDLLKQWLFANGESEANYTAYLGGNTDNLTNAKLFAEWCANTQYSLTFGGETLVLSSSYKNLNCTNNIPGSEISIEWDDDSKVSVTIDQLGKIRYKTITGATQPATEPLATATLKNKKTNTIIGVLKFNYSSTGAVASDAINYTEAKQATLTYPSGYYAWLLESVETFKIIDTKENLLAYATTIGANDADYQDYLYKVGPKSTDYSAKIEALKDFIDNGNERHYIYVLPKEIYEYDGLSAFTKLYIDTNAKQYFMIEVGENATSDGKWSKFEGQKSVIGVCNNGADASNDVLGAIAGKFASANFDISSSLKASPMNYKQISGFSYTELSSKVQRELIGASISYVSALANNTLIMNGRCADSRAIDYWYQWDITAFRIQSAITQLLLNGVNNPNYVIQYNQNGIDTITASIIATLNTMISYGCVTEFGASYNSATNELENIGYIYAIDYYTYISANPSDYEAETYGGISFYIRIGKYIRQVTMNVTLG